MSASVITFAFENWKAQEAASGKPVVLNEFIFALVPGLDITNPIDRNEGMPPESQIVHRQAVNKAGLASENAVAYSVTLGAEVGDFAFNWIGLINHESGTVAMITHAPTQSKLKTQAGQQGNVLTRSFLLEFSGAALETQINTRAETWQIDFTARLSGIDEMQRLVNLDAYGIASFMGDGFQVTRSMEQFTVRNGTGYVGGLRGELGQFQIFNHLRNTKIYVDFSYQGNITSQWRTVVNITTATAFDNYIDVAGFAHYVFAIASIDAEGNITDLRPVGSKADRKIEALENTTVNKGDIVHEKGDSDKKVMSQKAVTDELGKKLDKAFVQESTAASSINTLSGKSIQKELDDLSGSSALYPEMYITALEIDHTEAFKKMFSDALRLKRRVQAFGTYILSSTPDGISIGVPTDFSQADIICRSKENAVEWMQKTYIFKVEQAYQDVTHKFNMDDFSPGSVQSSITGYSGFIKISSADVVMVRWEDENTPTQKYKVEVNEVFENGKLKYINHYSHPFSSKMEFKPYLNQLVISLPTVVLDGAFIRSVINVSRNNTKIVGGNIQTKNNGHCQAYVENEDSCLFEMEDLTLSLDYSALNKGGYATTFKNTSSMTLERVVDAHGWSGVDGNCYRGLKINHCHLLTVAGHFSVSDIHVDNSVIINHVNGQGWGFLKVTRSRQLCPDNEPLRTVTTFSTKYDYGNSWEGIVIIDDFEVVLGSHTKKYYIVSAMEPKYDHEFIGHCPDIRISNVRINIDKLVYSASDITEIRFIDLGYSRQLGHEKFQVLPRYHEVTNVKIVGNRYFERIDINPVYNFRDYSTLSREDINNISGSHYLYTLKVSDIDVDKAGRSNGAAISACYVQGFRFTANDIPQQIDISNANYCIPCTSAWNNMTITVRNQLQNHVLFDNSTIGNGRSYNIVKFKECTIFGSRILGARNNRCAFIDFHDAHFEFMSKSKNPTVTDENYDKNNGVHLINAESPAVVVRVNECTAALETTEKTYDPKFKQWLQVNYKLNGYYL